MKLNTTISASVVTLAALLFSGCASMQGSGGPVNYYDEPQVIYDAVEKAVQRMGMKIEESEIRDDEGFRIRAVDDNASVLNTQSASAARLQRIYIRADPKLDGSLRVSVDVPSSRNYASMSGPTLRSDFYKYLRDQGLTTYDQIASNEES